MVDWKTYKGQVPFTCQKTNSANFKQGTPFINVPETNKIRYNEGNRIADFSDPVWTTDFTGVSITRGHDPCGYWHREPVLYLPPVFTPVTKSLGGLTCLWLENYGSADYGRFIIGMFGNSSTSSLKYSDDGGYNWTTITKPGGTVTQHFATLTYINGSVYGVTTTGVVSSADGGENWTHLASHGVEYLHNSTSLSYNPIHEKFVLGCNYGVIYDSPDGVTWTYNARPFLYGQNNFSLFYQNKTYLFNSGGSYFTSDDLSTWVAYGGSNFASVKGTFTGFQAFIWDDTLFYGQCKTRDGLVWERYTNAPCSYMSYNRNLNYAVSSGLSLLPSQYSGVYICTDKTTWVQEILPYSGLVKYGVGAGKDRYINVGQSLYGIIGIKTSGGTTTVYNPIGV